MSQVHCRRESLAPTFGRQSPQGRRTRLVLKLMTPLRRCCSSDRLPSSIWLPSAISPDLDIKVVVMCPRRGREVAWALAAVGVPGSLRLVLNLRLVDMSEREAPEGGGVWGKDSRCDRNRRGRPRQGQGQGGRVKGPKTARMSEFRKGDVRHLPAHHCWGGWQRCRPPGFGRLVATS